MKHPLPEAALSQNIAVLGKNGSGKTYAAKGSIVERLLEDGRRVGIVDPTGAWWGLRTSRDGKGAGFPILVLGGDHGDLPLPALGGAAVARLLAVQGVNLVADTSQLTVGERTRWFTDFAGALYRENRTPLHLVIDEAHNFAPQGKVPDPDAGKMLHAASTLASQGRSRGIRLTMITQRPQKLHKDSLTSADTLIAMRVIHPLDRGAVADWINGCGDPAKGKEVLDSLANLQRGEGWAWYPEGGFLQRMKFPAIATFDSSATPMDGAPVAQPKGAAEIDLTEIKAALADAVKEAEANNPKLLRARIAELERQLAKPRDPAVDVEALDKARRGGLIDGYGEAIKVLAPIADRLEAPLERAQAVLVEIRSTASAWAARGATLTREPHPKRIPIAPQLHPRSTQKPPIPSHSNGALPKVERAFLTALAQQARRLTRNQVAIFAGYSATSRHVDNTLAALRSKGYAEGGRDGIDITADGIAALGAYDPLPTGAGLRDYWIDELDKAASAFLGVICNAYPKSLTRDEIAGLAGYSPSSRHVDNTLAVLRSRDLVSGGRNAIRASENLFD